MGVLNMTSVQSNGTARSPAHNVGRRMLFISMKKKLGSFQFVEVVELRVSSCSLLGEISFYLTDRGFCVRSLAAALAHGKRKAVIE